jgi:hypothetical protein
VEIFSLHHETFLVITLALLPASLADKQQPKHLFRSRFDCLFRLTVLKHTLAASHEWNPNDPAFHFTL